MSQSFRCSNCGAPLDVSPETIATVCSYCGYLNWVREDLKEEILVVKPLSEREALKNVGNFSSKKKLGAALKEINLSKLTLILVPFYFVDVSAEADYSAKVFVNVRKCRKERDQEKCWTETRSVFVKGVYGPYAGVVPVVGRRGSEVLSVKALARRYIASKVDASPIGVVQLDKSEWRSVLSIEVDKKTAMDIALDDHLDRLRDIVVEVIRREAENRVRMRGESVVGSTIAWKRITPINVKASASKPILLPMYIAVYKYRDGVYRVVLCGWDGEVVVLEKPMGVVERVAWGSLAAVTSGVLGGLSGAMLTANPLAGLGLLVVGGATSWYCIRKALSPVKTTVAGPSFKDMFGSQRSGLSFHKFLR
ncbi:MAG: zinc ribbon domain-containing protein [Ignisphaera sp.]|uniref:Zinc ribbon domain-containing protein n=1 Tax=Ignisphaera aggregans TaxID=334771 RepID=A0A7C4JJV1_9CREN